MIEVKLVKNNGVNYVRIPIHIKNLLEIEDSVELYLNDKNEIVIKKPNINSDTRKAG